MEVASSQKNLEFRENLKRSKNSNPKSSINLNSNLCTVKLHLKGMGGTSAPTVYNSLCLIIKNSIDDTKRSSNRLKKSHNKCTSPRTEVSSVIVQPLSSSTLSLSFRFFVIKIDFNFRYEVSLNHFQLFAAY